MDPAEGNVRAALDALAQFWPVDDKPARVTLDVAQLADLAGFLDAAAHVEGSRSTPHVRAAQQQLAELLTFADRLNMIRFNLNAALVALGER